MADMGGLAFLSGLAQGIGGTANATADEYIRQKMRNRPLHPVFEQGIRAVFGGMGGAEAAMRAQHHMQYGDDSVWNAQSPQAGGDNQGSQENQGPVEMRRSGTSAGAPSAPGLASAAETEERPDTGRTSFTESEKAEGAPTPKPSAGATPSSSAGGLAAGLIPNDRRMTYGDLEGIQHLLGPMMMAGYRETPEQRYQRSVDTAAQGAAGRTGAAEISARGAGERTQARIASTEKMKANDLAQRQGASQQRHEEAMARIAELYSHSKTSGDASSRLQLYKAMAAEHAKASGELARERASFMSLGASLADDKTKQALQDDIDAKQKQLDDWHPKLDEIRKSTIQTYDSAKGPAGKSAEKTSARIPKGGSPGLMPGKESPEAYKSRVGDFLKSL